MPGGWEVPCTCSRSQYRAGGEMTGVEGVRLWLGVGERAGLRWRLRIAIRRSRVRAVLAVEDRGSCSAQEALAEVGAGRKPPSSFPGIPRSRWVPGSGGHREPEYRLCPPVIPRLTPAWKGQGQRE